ncbi:hypothetical protein [Mycobacterium sp.]|jgi:hypothetical protein|uniref:hypothetical protein n=1 Tax=Mycobacterium sp. TaxID=1785 RepID=UPI002D3B3B02|nr:hypothetical protein [Mycobacterium sp.]HZA08692.1 hypothetical protein [Mycobacterium sp.]
MSDAAETNKEFAATARETVDAIEALAKEVSGQVSANYFTLGAMIRSMAKLASIAGVSGLRFAEAALETRLDAGQMLVADNLATTARRMVGQARYVAEEASSNISANSYGVNAWVRSLTKLADIGMMGGIEMAQTAAIGPASYGSPAFISDVFKASPSNDDRLLRMAELLKRPGTADEIPENRVTVQPQRLKPGATDFYLVVDEENLQSGVYLGTVKVGEDEIVPVAIRL